MKMENKNHYLLLAAISSGLAALLHLGCIFWGGDGYRFFGAGEAMAQMAEAGALYPTLITLGITFIFILWSLYALSGAGIITKLPFIRTLLMFITSIYLLRGVAFIAIMPMFPENSLTFWLVSSTICLFIGMAYALGLKQAWRRLSARGT